MILGSSLGAARYLLQPAVAQIMDRAQPPVCHKPFAFEIFTDFANDDLVLMAFGKQMTLATRFETDDRMWAKIVARLEHWVDKNKPRQHNRYRPIPQIKTRRPSS